MGREVTVLNPPEIDIVFETRLQSTGVSEKIYRNSIKSDGTINDELNNNEKIYYTHPAFRNRQNIVFDESTLSRGGWDAEVTGMWAGKFETDTDTEICNTTSNVENCKEVNPIIKPDVKTLAYQNEYAMGNFNNQSNSSGFVSMPEEKYYDFYNSTVHSSEKTKAKTILGDASWETFSWYSDYPWFVVSGLPWMIRGQDYDNKTKSSGIFSSYGGSGVAGIKYRFRTVLIP